MQHRREFLLNNNNKKNCATFVCKCYFILPINKLLLPLQMTEPMNEICPFLLSGENWLFLSYIVMTLDQELTWILSSITHIIVNSSNGDRYEFYFKFNTDEHVLKLTFPLCLAIDAK